jgi:hypothetical protein
MVSICSWSRQPICFIFSNISSILILLIVIFEFFNVCIKSVKLSENAWTKCQEVPADNRQVTIAHTDGMNFKMTISDTAGGDPDVFEEFTVTDGEANSKLFQDYFTVTPVALSDFIDLFKDDHRTIRSNKIFDANSFLSSVNYMIHVSLSAAVVIPLVLPVQCFENPGAL